MAEDKQKVSWEESKGECKRRGEGGFYVTEAGAGIVSFCGFISDMYQCYFHHSSPVHVFRYYTSTSHYPISHDVVRQTPHVCSIQPSYKDLPLSCSPLFVKLVQVL